MTKVYPVILTPTKIGSKKGFAVHVPDLQIDTQGHDLAEAVFMARDAIGLWGICREDGNRPVPEPSTVPPPHEPGEMVTWVDIDLDEYRRKHDTRAVRRNITLPAWLDEAAKKANINVSGFIQNALKEYLRVSEPQ